MTSGPDQNPSRTAKPSAASIGMRMPAAFAAAKFADDGSFDRAERAKIAALAEAFSELAICDPQSANGPHATQAELAERMRYLQTVRNRLLGSKDLDEFQARAKEIASEARHQLPGSTAEQRAFEAMASSAMDGLSRAADPENRHALPLAKLDESGNPVPKPFAPPAQAKVAEALRELAQKYGLKTASLAQAGALSPEEALRQISATDQALARACAELGMEPKAFGFANAGGAQGTGGYNLAISEKMLAASNAEGFVTNPASNSVLALKPDGSPQSAKTAIHEWQHMLDYELGARAKELWRASPEKAPARQAHSFPDLFSDLNPREQDALMPQAALGLRKMLSALNDASPEDLEEGGKLRQRAHEIRMDLAERLTAIAKSKMLADGKALDAAQSARLYQALETLAGDPSLPMAVRLGFGDAPPELARPQPSQAEFSAAKAAGSLAETMYGSDTPENRAKALSDVLKGAREKELGRESATLAAVAASRSHDALPMPKSDFAKASAMSENSAYWAEATELNSRAAGRDLSPAELFAKQLSLDARHERDAPAMSISKTKQFNDGMKLAAGEAGTEIRPLFGARAIASGALAPLASASKKILRAAMPAAQEFAGAPHSAKLAGATAAFAGLSWLNAYQAYRAPDNGSSLRRGYNAMDFGVNVANAATQTAEAFGKGAQAALVHPKAVAALAQASPSAGNAGLETAKNAAKSAARKTLGALAAIEPEAAAAGRTLGPAAFALSFAGAGKSSLDAWRAKKAGQNEEALAHAKAAGIRAAGAAGSFGAAVLSGAAVGSAFPIAGTLVGAVAGAVVGITAEWLASKEEFAAKNENAAIRRALEQASKWDAPPELYPEIGELAQNSWKSEWQKQKKNGLDDDKALAKANEASSQALAAYAKDKLAAETPQSEPNPTSPLALDQTASKLALRRSQSKADGRPEHSSDSPAPRAAS